MSLFQCEQCGCCENTAVSAHSSKYMPELFIWTGIEDRKDKLLCSACGPTKYSDGKPTGYGIWHGRFPRVYLPIGKFITNKVGNLAYIDTGDEDYRKYAIEPSPNS